VEAPGGITLGAGTTGKVLGMAFLRNSTTTTPQTLFPILEMLVRLLALRLVASTDLVGGCCRQATWEMFREGGLPCRVYAPPDTPKNVFSAWQIVLLPHSRFSQVTFWACQPNSRNLLCNSDGVAVS
jgi:hypothetical protein